MASTTETRSAPATETRPAPGTRPSENAPWNWQSTMAPEQPVPTEYRQVGPGQGAQPAVLPERRRRASETRTDPGPASRRDGAAKLATGSAPATGNAPTTGSAPTTSSAPTTGSPPAIGSAPTTTPDRRPAGPARATGRRRGRLVAALAVAVVAVVAAAGTAVVLSHKPPAGPAAATGPRIGDAGSVLTAASAQAPMPTAAGIAAALAGPLKDARLGTHVTAEVADLATGTVLFGQNPKGPTTPASTMKLATTISVLATRGPQYRITTRVVAGPQPGQVVLIGAGDPTLGATASPTYPESGTLVQLADQVKTALGTVKPTKVIIDGTLFPGATTGPGWQPDDITNGDAANVTALIADSGRVDPAKTGDSKRWPDPAGTAGATFARYLGLPATAVVHGKAPQTPAGTPAATTPGAVLASVQSAPLQRIIETMLANSDNMLAEYMARQVALATGRPATFAGGAAAVTAELTKLGLPMQGVTILDGSGLSHNDRLTPALLAAIISTAAQPDHPDMHALFTGLPVAGWSGTLQHRFTASNTTTADGMLRAKTGTLIGVSALAGYVIDASGRALVFVVLTDAAPPIGTAAALDVIGATLRGCGCGSAVG
jgi:serine-type D-Ala-D-Ala carboxypeptidase/endopeptidase (penicillin-binding protein 4)